MNETNQIDQITRQTGLVLDVQALLHISCHSGEGARSCHMISCRDSPASPQPNPRSAMWTGNAVYWNIAASASKNFACDRPISKPPICCYLDTFPLHRSSRY